MITNSQYIAYQIWQLNGGNKFYPLPSTFANVHPRPSKWEEWATREISLTSVEKRNLLEEKDFRKIPYFAFHPRPFDFDLNAKRDLLLNWFGRDITDEASVGFLRQHVDNVMRHNPDARVDDMFTFMQRIGY